MQENLTIEIVAEFDKIKKDLKLFEKQLKSQKVALPFSVEQTTLRSSKEILDFSKINNFLSVLEKQLQTDFAGIKKELQAIKQNTKQSFVNALQENIGLAFSNKVLSVFGKNVYAPLQPFLNRFAQSAVRKGQEFVSSNINVSDLKIIADVFDDLVNNIADIEIEGIVENFNILQQSLTNFFPSSLSFFNESLLTSVDSINSIQTQIEFISNEIKEITLEDSFLQSLKKIFLQDIPEIFKKSQQTVLLNTKKQQEEIAQILASEQFTSQGLGKLGRQLGAGRAIYKEKSTNLLPKTELAQVISVSFSPSQIKQAIQKLGNEIKSKKYQELKIDIRPNLSNEEFLKTKKYINSLKQEIKTLLDKQEINKSLLLFNSLNAKIKEVRKEFQLTKGQSSSFLGSINYLQSLITSVENNLSKNPNIEKNWEKTIQAIKKELEDLQNSTSIIGYEIQKNISEGSPGITKNIREYWETTTNFINSQINKVQEIAENSGQAIESNLTPSSQKIKDFFESFSNNLPSITKKGALIGVGLLGLSKITDLIIGGITNIFSSLTQSFTNLISNIGNVTTEFIRFNSTLEISLGSAFFAQKALKDISTEAKELGISIQSASLNFAKFKAAAQGTTLAKDADQIFKGFQTGVAAFNLSAEETNGVFLALTQIIGKGKLTAEEWRQQLSERLPIASQIASKALGLSVKEFSQALDKGKIKIEDLSIIAQEFTKQFDKVKEIDNINKSFQKLQNTFYETQLRLGLVFSAIAKPFIDGFTAVLDYFSRDFLPLFIGGSIDFFEQYFKVIQGKIFPVISQFIGKILTSLGGIKGIIFSIGARLWSLIKILNGVYGNLFDTLLLLYTNFTSSKKIIAELEEKLKSSSKLINDIRDSFIAIQTSSNVDLGLSNQLQKVNIELENAKQKLKEITPSETLLFGLVDIEKIRQTFASFSDLGKVIAGVTTLFSGFLVVTTLFPGIVGSATLALQKLSVALLTSFVSPLGLTIATIGILIFTISKLPSTLKTPISALATLILGAILAIQLGLTPLIALPLSIVASIGVLLIASQGLNKAFKILGATAIVLTSSLLLVKAVLAGLVALPLAIAGGVAILGIALASLSGGTKNIKFLTQEQKIANDYLIKTRENVTSLTDAYYELRMARIKLQKAQQKQPEQISPILLSEAFEQELKAAKIELDALNEQKTAAYASLQAAINAGDQEAKNQAEDDIKNVEGVIKAREKNIKILIKEKALTDANIKSLQEIIATQEQQTEQINAQNQLIETQLDIIGLKGLKTYAEIEKEKFELTKKRLEEEIKLEEQKLISVEKTRKDAIQTLSEIYNIPIKEITDEIALSLLADDASISQETKDLYKLAFDESKKGNIKLKQLRLDAEKTDLEIIKGGIDEKLDQLNRETELKINTLENSFERNKYLIETQAREEKKLESTKNIELLAEEIDHNNKLIKIKTNRLRRIKLLLKDETTLTKDQYKELLNEALSLETEINNLQLQSLNNQKDMVGTRISQIDEEISSATEAQSVHTLKVQSIIAKKLAEGAIFQKEASLMSMQYKKIETNALISFDEYRIKELERLQKTIGLTADQEKELVKARNQLATSKFEAPKKLYDEFIQSAQDGIDLLEFSAKQRESSIQQLVNSGVISRKEADRQLAESNRQLNRDRYNNDYDYFLRLQEFNKENPTIEGYKEIEQRAKALNDLQNQLLQDEYQKQQELIDLANDKLNQQAKSLDLRNQELDLQLKLLDIQTKALDSQQRLFEAQNRLNTALANLGAGRNQLMIDELNAQLDIVSNEKEQLRIKKEIYELEKKATQDKITALINEQKQQLISLDIEEKRAEIEARRTDIANKQALNQAQNQILQQQIALNEARKTGDQTEIALATDSLKLAYEGLSLTQEDIKANNELNRISQETAQLNRQATLAEQRLAREQLAQEESFRLNQFRREIDNLEKKAKQTTEETAKQIQQTEPQTGADRKVIIDESSFKKKIISDTAVPKENVATEATAQDQLMTLEEIKRDNQLRAELEGNLFDLLQKGVIGNQGQIIGNPENNQKIKDTFENVTLKTLNLPQMVTPTITIDTPKQLQFQNTLLDGLNKIYQQLINIGGQKPIINQTNEFVNQFASNNEKELLRQARNQTLTDLNNLFAQMA